MRLERLTFTWFLNKSQQLYVNVFTEEEGASKNSSQINQEICNEPVKSQGNFH